MHDCNASRALSCLENGTGSRRAEVVGLTRIFELLDQNSAGSSATRQTADLIYRYGTLKAAAGEEVQQAIRFALRDNSQYRRAVPPSGDDSAANQSVRRSREIMHR